ncbi:sensor histidine kinase [Amycolatopsis panacis]|uniref:sensor histidine kinase n=1 Tax=Amycolatopsis panacis TaxID=2340917 RepID=UPI001F23BC2E|nr:nitrate- and nitrite sensing domain-containing protein [Amycolatopsis panacis]
MRWRDWSLPVKLSAVTLVPIVLALVLGITAIVGQVSRSSDYQRVDRLVMLSAQLRALTDGLQRERTLTAAQLTAGTSGVTPELKSARAATDAAIGPFTEAAGRAGPDGSSLSGAVNSATAQVNEIAVIRQQVGAGLLHAAEVVDDYTAVTTALIAADTAVSAGVSADALGSTPAALHDLEAAKEQASVTQAIVAYGIAGGSLTQQQLSKVRDAQLRYDDRIADFTASATAPQRQDLDSTLKPDTAYDVKRMAGLALGDQGAANGTGLRQLSAPGWGAASEAVTAQLGEVGKRMTVELTAASRSLVEDASSSAGLLAVLLFAALAVAVAVVFVISRQLLRSLNTLRRSALDVAEKDLPDAVRNIQEGRAQSVEVAPVPVQVQDEVGEVARAFEKVHSQALRLATEQAAMRAGYSSVFVNLSRRSQSLVQRQLQLIERLERDEEDADQLATLFQLDHLATRMRRNNENLMVLSGAEPGRRSGQPVAVRDVLRAAVSEIEQYQRVSVQHPPAVKIVGFAASDVQRLVAELLDNATAFSAPETQVTVATRLAEDGSLNVDILDKGIGMNEYEVVEANGRLTDSGSVDLATSRRMGLFVVGRLAGRHRIGVSLHGGKDIVGVRATVVVPPELVMGGSVIETGPIAGMPAGAATSSGLPRRQRPANGATRPGMLPPTAGRPVDGARPPSDLEVSGTALFSPIPRDEQAPPPPPQLPQIVNVPPPRPETPPPPPPEPPRDERAGALPAGKDLFAAAAGGTLSDWWSQAAQQVPEVPPPSAAETTIENTPIFDEMLSAWFRSPAPSAEPAEAAPAAAPADVAPVTTPEQDERNWDFASDENWRTVQAVTQSAPTAFTKVGLPRRRRGEQLLPGSATPDAVTPEPDQDKPELPVRDPSDIRGRLTSFQRGVNRGRQAVRESGAAEQPGGVVGFTPAAPDVPVPGERPAGTVPSAGGVPGLLSGWAGQQGPTGSGSTGSVPAGEEPGRAGSLGERLGWTGGGAPGEQPGRTGAGWPGRAGGGVPGERAGLAGGGSQPGEAGAESSGEAGAGLPGRAGAGSSGEQSGWAGAGLQPDEAGAGSLPSRDGAGSPAEQAGRTSAVGQPGQAEAGSSGESADRSGYAPGGSGAAPTWGEPTGQAGSSPSSVAGAGTPGSTSAPGTQSTSDAAGVASQGRPDEADRPERPTAMPRRTPGATSPAPPGSIGGGSLFPTAFTPARDVTEPGEEPGRTPATDGTPPDNGRSRVAAAFTGNRGQTPAGDDPSRAESGPDQSADDTATVDGATTGPEDAPAHPADEAAGTGYFRLPSRDAANQPSGDGRSDSPQAGPEMSGTASARPGENGVSAGQPDGPEQAVPPFGSGGASDDGASAAQPGGSERAVRPSGLAGSADEAGQPGGSDQAVQATGFTGAPAEQPGGSDQALQPSGFTGPPSDGVPAGQPPGPDQILEPAGLTAAPGAVPAGQPDDSDPTVQPSGFTGVPGSTPAGRTEALQPSGLAGLSGDAAGQPGDQDRTAQPSGLTGAPAGQPGDPARTGRPSGTAGDDTTHPDGPDQGVIPDPAGRPERPGSLPTRRRGASEVPPGPAAVDPGQVSAPVAGAGGGKGESEWTFGSDEGWRTVDAVSQSAPASFTSAGLPRRRRGEQLLPGSAPPPSGVVPSRPSRDAHDVRGRLSSFQQGIQRGRHRTAQGAEKNHETLEGE